MNRITRCAGALALVWTFAACGDEELTNDTGSSGTGTGQMDAGVEETDGGREGSFDGGSGNPSDAGSMEPMRCPLADEVQCVDAQITDLTLYDAPSPDGVTNEPLDDGFRSVIDATGGVMFGGGPPVPTQSFVYVRFTDSGLEKVELSDEEAFESGAWDLAARRFLVRVNSGVSGPSCVQVARTAPDTAFADLTQVPEGLTWRTEEYYSVDDCTIVPGPSGLGSPGVALGSYWTYQSCVEMTGNVYVLELADGRAVKLEVESYYAPDVQDYCQTNKTLPSGRPSGSGRLQLRWAFLD